MDELTVVSDSDRRAQILDAAFIEFTSKGFRGATIKSIARRAGVQSPTLIYWYFPTKEALFQAVIEAHSPLLQASVDPSSLLDLPPETVLPLFARSYFAFFTQPAERQMLRLMLAEAVQRPEIANDVGARLADQVLSMLKQYLTRQVERGRLRPHDVRAGARAFIGMLIPHAVGMVLVPALRADGLSTDDHIAACIEIFLRGLHAEPAPPY